MTKELPDDELRTWLREEFTRNDPIAKHMQRLSVFVERICADRDTLREQLAVVTAERDQLREQFAAMAKLLADTARLFSGQLREELDTFASSRLLRRIVGHRTEQVHEGYQGKQDAAVIELGARVGERFLRREQ